MSFLRCSTTYASNPYVPIPASSSAATPNAVSSDMLNRGERSLVARSSGMVAKLLMVNDGFTRCTRSRMTLATVAGGTDVRTTK